MSTRALFKNLLTKVLCIKNYSVQKSGSYFLATKGSQRYRMMLVARIIPEDTETTIIEASQMAVERFLKSKSSRHQNYIDCIAYGIGVEQGGDLQSLELMILPISAFDSVPLNIKTGDVLSRASYDYHYNYQKYQTPIGEVLRWSLE